MDGGRGSPAWPVAAVGGVCGEVRGGFEVIAGLWSGPSTVDGSPGGMRLPERAFCCGTLSAFSELADIDMGLARFVAV